MTFTTFKLLPKGNMQISRHWRLNSQRYRLEGERIQYMVGDEMVDEMFSTQPGKSPSREWTKDQERKVEQARMLTIQFLITFVLSFARSALSMNESTDYDKRIA